MLKKALNFKNRKKSQVPDSKANIENVSNRIIHFTTSFIKLISKHYKNIVKMNSIIDIVEKGSSNSMISENQRHRVGK